LSTATQPGGAPPRLNGTGRRKEAVARVFLRPGSGKLTVNGRPIETYFKPIYGWERALEPFRLTDTTNQFDGKILVQGGGLLGQLDAVRLGFARALVRLNAELRPILRKGGLLTRDPRMKERKKYGQKGARKRFQYSKR
jgi:small subunit ribosomal protein S9